MAGSSNSINGDVTGNNGSSDCWVVKLSGDGELIWQKSLGGSDPDFATSMHIVDDGFILVGRSNSSDGDISTNQGGFDFWVVRLSDVGSIIWQKSFGGSLSDIPNSVFHTGDEGFILAGVTKSNDGDVIGHHGGEDFWVVKLNDLGDIEWQKCLGGSKDETAMDVKPTPDNGFIVLGYTSSSDGDVSNNHGGNDIWIVKLDGIGNIEWEHSLGGSKDDLASSVLLNGNGGYVVAGFSYSNDDDVSNNQGEADIWVVELDSSGKIVWESSFGGSLTEGANQVGKNESGYIIVGSTFSNDGDIFQNHGELDYWIIQLDATGEIIWQKTLGGSDSEEAFGLQYTDNEEVVIGGWTKSSDGDVSGQHGNFDIWVVKLGNSSSIENKAPLPVKLYPNPCQDFITISLNVDLSNSSIKLIDQFGRKILQQPILFDNKINVSYLPPGIYQLKIMANDGIIYQDRFVKQ